MLCEWMNWHALIIYQIIFFAYSNLKDDDEKNLNYFKRLDAHVVASTFQLLKDRPIELFEDKVDLAALPKDLNQVDDVVVFELFQDSNFSQSSFSHL